MPVAAPAPGLDAAPVLSPIGLVVAGWRPWHCRHHDILPREVWHVLELRLHLPVGRHEQPSDWLFLYI
jgi:hypothetical protein